MRDHISASSINMFLRCQAQWFFRYIEDIKIPPGSALTLGRSYDRGCESQFNSRLHDEKDLPLHEIHGKFEEEWDALRDETDWKENEEPSKLKDTGINCLTAYHKNGMLGINPTAVQERFNIPFKDPSLPDLLGFIDVIHENDIIIDQKTAGRNKNNPDHNTQMLIYAIGCKQKYNKTFKLRLDYAIKKKTPEIILKEVKIKEGEIDFQLRQVVRIARNMNIFEQQPTLITPNRNHPWACDSRYCGFFDLCHKTF